MAGTATAVINKPVWVDLATSDAAAARDFYSKVFGWTVEVNPDPQYGAYGRAKVHGKDAAGIGPVQTQDQPVTWSLYIGTDDVDGLAGRVTAAAGKVAGPPFDVGDQGRMAVFQDPSGAFISAWQGTRMGGFETQGANAFGWAELHARGVEKVVPFYETVFGWKTKTSGTADQPYTEFQIDGPSFAGATEMEPNTPAQVPNYWLVYFIVEDVDSSHRRALGLGGKAVVEPFDFPGGRMSIVTDPQGASFGLLRLAEG